MFLPEKDSIIEKLMSNPFPPLSLYKSLNTILRNVFIDAMVKELYLEIFFKKVIFTKFYGKVRSKLRNFVSRKVEFVGLFHLFLIHEKTSFLITAI